MKATELSNICGALAFLSIFREVKASAMSVTVWCYEQSQSTSLFFPIGWLEPRASTSSGDSGPHDNTSTHRLSLPPLDLGNRRSLLACGCYV